MAEQEAQKPEKRLSVVKIYVKDFSFESPQSPGIFNAKEWAPNTNLNPVSYTHLRAHETVR